MIKKKKRREISNCLYCLLLCCTCTPLFDHGWTVVFQHQFSDLCLFQHESHHSIFFGTLIHLCGGTHKLKQLKILKSLKCIKVNEIYKMPMHFPFTLSATLCLYSFMPNPKPLTCVRFIKSLYSSYTIWKLKTVISFSSIFFMLIIIINSSNVMPLSSSVLESDRCEMLDCVMPSNSKKGFSKHNCDTGSN
jgi:hypothetical protein